LIFIGLACQQACALSQIGILLEPCSQFASQSGDVLPALRKLCSLFLVQLFKEFLNPKASLLDGSV
jgi:hypothetical protein